ncbi:excinuclease ABC subunit UvrC [Gemella sp. GH3]|uniref:excinuclease ABC subunit UvrC n=1 Tax=unclassified Gemella TaxID=2624949 RepID=UPI0015D0430E|nr:MULTISPECIES: excinuclease ABC subunit UvrC [unclassified Gemella]MBF0714378.1 excinuclease ABC subunit UvrC [Gemella sp. GH3.1]NYS51330.1 excinuclease ABC subunit UvrC [Gemella sp. GH3]
MNEILRKKLKLLPDEPGCYLYKDELGDIIYVGKAKNLKNRIKSYFTGTHNKKTQLLVSNIYDLEYIIVNSEKEALLLENNLIKKYKPHYNIRLKDDKTYPYLMITKEEHPRIILTRKYKKNSANIYFGPYVDIKSATQLKKIIDKIYPLRKCNPIEKRACTYYQIGECIGPCAKKVTNEEYKNQIKNIKNFLNGNTKNILNKLDAKLKSYVENLEFENAATIYEYIQAIKISVENQNISMTSNIDRDYIGYYYDENYICIQIFLSRMGNIIERKVEYYNLYSDYTEVLYSYIIQYYALNIAPKEVFIEGLDVELLTELIGVKFINPKKGYNKKIIDTLKNNAKYYLDNNIKIEEEKEKQQILMLNNLAKQLGVTTISNIDAFDNSNIMGQDAVSVKVNFLNGKKNTYGYRKFKVKYTEGINDIETMKEVLFRTYKDKDTKTNLIIVDGGKNHVTAAIDIVHNMLELNIKIIGLAKNSNHITEYIVTDDYEIITLDKHSEQYLFLKKIQDEVHRFAITYHRSLKTKNMFSSPLDNIKGIGAKRKKILLENFSSIEELKKSSQEKLKKLGIPKDVILEIKNKL